MRKKLALLIMSLSIMMPMVGCNQNTDKQCISVTIGQEPKSLDPALTDTSDTTGAYISHLLQGLIEIDAEGSLRGGVAEEWNVNEDKTVYTFKLRENAKWSDGKNVTAEDFKYAWLRVLNPDTASSWAQHMYYIKNGENYNKGFVSSEEVGIKVINDYELQVEMEEPCVFFLNLVTLQPYYPVRKDIIEANQDKWTEQAATYIGNGAYTLKDWKHDNYVELAKSETYWNADEVKLDDIKYYLLTDANAALNAYESGEIDYVENLIPIQELERLRETEEYEAIGSTISRFICLNTESPILKNDKVRQAISVALDREEMIKLSGISGTPAVSFIPYGFYNEIENKDFLSDSHSTKYIEKNSNIDKAKQLLEEAGFKDGEGLPEIEFATNEAEINVMTAEIIEQQLKKLGINVKINVMEHKVFSEYRATKQFDMCIGGWWSEYPDLTSYIYLFKSDDPNNCFNFNSARFDDLYKQIVKETDVAHRYELIHEAEKEIMDSYCAIPLYYVDIDSLNKKDIKGIIHNSSVYINFADARGE